MSIREEVFDTESAPRPLIRLEEQLTRLLYLDAEKLAYAAIFILAVLSRFWDLGARVMSHDESLHVRYSWNLYKGEGFQHTPLMHGPLLFHMTALNYLLFGDNDFSGRIYAAIVGIIVVMLPYFMRRWLGRMGAIAASVMLLISPMILYYSRYIREDIPAILGALLMVLGIWYYIEDRKFRYLLWLTIGFAILYATKEVSFIYVAIFGSFLSIYFVTRMLDAPWENPTWRTVFAIATIAILILLLVAGGLFLYEKVSSLEALPAPALPGEAAPIEATSPLRLPLIVVGALIAVALVGMVVSGMFGQWPNLRSFPELDVLIVMGTLILPMLSPIAMHLFKLNPMDESELGIRLTGAFTAPFVLISILVGLIWGMTPPRRSRIETTENDPDLPDSGEDSLVNEPSAIDWLQALLTSRWIAIGALFWVFFLFFFTTMFTNGNGLGTGVVGSLGYWLEQQEVKRGNQPWYYYLIPLVPIYEFLPALLSIAAGAVGLKHLLRRNQTPESEEVRVEAEAADDGDVQPQVRRRTLDLNVPIAFPVFIFTAYWIVMNFVAYSIAGEKMPWLTTHITVPMIILSAWVVGQMVERIEWRRLSLNYAWVVLLLLPMLAVSLLRVAAPICNIGAAEQTLRAARMQEQVRLGMAPEQFQIDWAGVALGAARLPCNTFIPVRFQNPIFAGPSLTQLSATSAWLAAAVVFVVTIGALFYFGRGLPLEQARRLAAFGLVLYLGFLTARAAWMAAYINYDYATEYLVYAHSAGAVKDVLGKIEEISLKTTDGYGLRVAYDNRVSWPYSWYFRNFYNAIYFGEQPSRGLIGDAPVVVAGPDNWAKVEPILGDRYYTFEYIRMWWPMQDYFDLDARDFANFFADPDMQRGIWDIFYRRDYTAYSQAVTDYRASQPSFALSDWPVAERMRLYVRKDVVAQVWDYGVTASEIATSIDPYAEGMRQALPEQTLGAGELLRPHGADLGPDGLLYIADSGNHRIAVLDRDGNFIRSFGHYGLAPAEDVLNEPWDVAVAPSGDVYVADTWNHRVVQFTAEGEFVRAWGFEGPSRVDPDAFWGPRGIEVDEQGNVYVADTGNKRIQVFDSEGSFIDQIGIGGAQDGQLDEPAGVEVGPDGLLYVADTWNQRIEVFTAEGIFIRMWYVDAWFVQSNERPYLDVDNRLNVYVTDPEAYRVIVFDSTGRYLYSFGDSMTIALAGSVLVDPQGYIFVIDTENGTVQRYSPDSLLAPSQ